MKHWVRRASWLHDQLAEVADLNDRRWWLLAGTAAIEWGAGGPYVLSDAEPASDTFIGHAVPAPADPIADAIARAHAARIAIRELDGTLPDQPLAATIAVTTDGAHTQASALTTVAFAVRGRTWITHLRPQIDDEYELAGDLATALAGRAPDHLVPLDDADAPFVCVTLGEESGTTARHCHRRAWTTAGGPWLGCSRADGMSIVSTCHFAVDGYGHAALAARITTLTAQLAPRVPRVARPTNGHAPDLPSPATVAGAIPLRYTWREHAPGLRALPLAYALGIVLHRLAGDRSARFSPTFQIPIAPGSRDDADRPRRRVIPAIASVRFMGGAPERFDAFAARTKLLLAREAEGRGLASRLHASLRALPAPLVWKRRAMGAQRPGWMTPFAAVLGGRACVSRIELDLESPPACAVSSPARLAGDDDPLGGCVITVIDDGTRAAITLCGAGEVARRELLDEVLARIPR